MTFNYKTSPQPDSGWTLDGIAFYGFRGTQPGTLPVYQFYNDSAGYWKNQFSFSKDPPGPGWNYIGPLFSAYSNILTPQTPCSLAVYEFRSDDFRYLYTINGSTPQGPGWIFNGVKCYVFWNPKP